jgi:hypothetical protein
MKLAGNTKINDVVVVVGGGCFNKLNITREVLHCDTALGGSAVNPNTVDH